MKLVILNENVSQLNYIKKHIKTLSSRYVDDIARHLYDADPTPNKKYIKWLIKQFNNTKISIDHYYIIAHPQLRLPEDSDRIRESLQIFDRYKDRIPSEYRDIMKLDIYEFEKIIDEYAFVGKSSYVQLGNKVPDGAKLLISKGPYKVFVVEQIDKLESDEETKQKINALETLGIGSKWCTRAGYDAGEDESMASHYLADADVYVVYKNNKPFLQFDISSQQLMDVYDHEVQVDDLDDGLRLLLIDSIPDHNIYNTRFKVFRLGSKNEEDLNEIIKIPNWSVEYARDVIGGRWPEAEPRILQDGEYIYEYAREVIGGRWPEAEPIIMKDPAWACSYAADIIHGRWPEAEPIIMKDPETAQWYALRIVKGRWLEAEKSIMRDPNASFRYAANIIHGRWPEAESTIMKDPQTAFLYATRFIKGRWPEAEPYIASDKLWADKYDRILRFTDNNDYDEWAAIRNRTQDSIQSDSIE